MTNANAQDNTVKKHRVVFQLSTGDSLEQKGFIKQLYNLQHATDSIDIEVVIQAQGINFITKASPYSAEIEKLSSAHLKFLVCRNTMNTKHVTEEDLLPQAKIIPAGILHIIERQEQGWSYIKAGF